MFDAQTTKEQIGRGVLMSCGARDFVAGKDFLQFTVGSAPRKLCKLIITLKDDDTYSVRYVEMARSTCKVLQDEATDGVHVDNLRGTVRRMGDR